MSDETKHINNFNKNNGFKVPDNYFEELPDKIMTKIDYDEQTTRSKIISFLRPVAAVAAVFVIVFTIWKLFLTNVDNDKNTINNTETYTDASYYNDYQIIEAAYANDTEFLEDTLNTEEIIEYLAYEDIDYTIILEEY